jgi:hypothetical protein
LKIDEWSQQISDIFDTFSSKSSILTTGASKALHMINPKLFVMWDNTIRTFYHRLHDDYARSSSPVETCYVKFLTTCNQIAVSLETEYEWLMKAHPSFEVYGFSKSIPKMIDECNFVRFFLNRNWV